MPGITELNVGNMSADLYARNILDQKSSTFEPKGKVMMWRREHVSNVKFKQLTQYIGRSARW